MPGLTLIFVHGWSVTNLDTYGKLPARLTSEAAKAGIGLSVQHVFLSRYISFHDEVRLPDISRAFQTAITEQLSADSTFICITHSTGGPVIRDWWDRYCKGKRPKLRMSHLIMLAPANFGSALARLGKGTLSRLKSWWSGIEPGLGVLDWLTLGSTGSRELNMSWIDSDGSQINPSGFYPFVLTGQTIDRQLYDAVNSYTGESGSDGVVRVAAANLNATYVRLAQPKPYRNTAGKLVAEELAIDRAVDAPRTAMRVVAGKAHSGKDIGIMNSVGANDTKSADTVAAILDCIRVGSKKDYEALTEQFDADTARVQLAEKVEIEKRMLLTDRYFIHDRYTMIVFRIMDSEGYPITDFDLMFTADVDNNPNMLPEGFLLDRQLNRLEPNVLTFYLNYDLLTGSEEVLAADGKVLRPKTVGITKLGIRIRPRPDTGFVRYLECRYTATAELFSQALKPNSTTMIDIVMQRIVDKEVLRLETKLDPKNFANVRPSGDFVE